MAYNQFHELRLDLKLNLKNKSDRKLIIMNRKLDRDITRSERVKVVDHDTIKKLNLLILSMVTKQEVLNNLESELFTLNIYEEYINHLIDINLKLMNLEEQRESYTSLIKDFKNGEILSPDQVIEYLNCNAQMI